MTTIYKDSIRVCVMKKINPESVLWEGLVLWHISHLVFTSIRFFHQQFKINSTIKPTHFLMYGTLFNFYSLVPKGRKSALRLMGWWRWLNLSGLQETHKWCLSQAFHIWANGKMNQALWKHCNFTDLALISGIYEGLLLVCYQESSQ